ncbi:MAG: FecR domain-containing protein [Chitinophagaceae bacterium]
MPHSRLIILFDRYLSKACTEAEREELAQLILSSDQDETVKELLEKAWVTTSAEVDMPEESIEFIFNSILENVKDRYLTIVPRNERARRDDKGAVRMWKHWTVAASIGLALGIGSYFLFINKGTQQPEIVKANGTQDVKAPETNRAMITLADGRKVYLDSAANGSLAKQGDVELTKQADGKIVYEILRSAQDHKAQYNTLINPRGSKVIDMTLADGSRVWLNAGSSVTYPVAFVGSERKVEITGEAYFEVAHLIPNPSPQVEKGATAVPFIVKKGDVEVTVLGTHFNVNAYDDEEAIKVTLLEGSVMVKSEKSNVKLSPSQQATVFNSPSGDGGIRVNNSPNLDEVMAWKNGMFSFSKADIKTIMREVARWYNIDIVYETDVRETFYVKVRRDANVSDVFKILKTTGAIDFRIEGNKVTVVK